MPGFQSFFRPLHYFVLARLATSSIRFNIEGDPSHTTNNDVYSRGIHLCLNTMYTYMKATDHAHLTLLALNLSEMLNSALFVMINIPIEMKIKGRHRKVLPNILYCPCECLRYKHPNPDSRRNKWDLE